MWQNPFGREHAVIIRLVAVLMTVLTGGAALAAEEAVVGEEAAVGDAVVENTCPLETCIVTDAELGSMGEPVVYDYKGREIRFCCAGCIPSFESDPDKYMEKLPPFGGEPAGATHDHKNCGGH